MPAFRGSFKKYLIYSGFFFFFSFGCAMQLAGILLPQPGISIVPPKVEACSITHRITREAHDTVSVKWLARNSVKW